MRKCVHNELNAIRVRMSFANVVDRTAWAELRLATDWLYSHVVRPVYVDAQFYDWAQHGVPSWRVKQVTTYENPVFTTLHKLYNTKLDIKWELTLALVSGDFSAHVAKSRIIHSMDPHYLVRVGPWVWTRGKHLRAQLSGQSNIFFCSSATPLEVGCWLERVWVAFDAQGGVIAMLSDFGNFDGSQKADAMFHNGYQRSFWAPPEEVEQLLRDGNLLFVGVGRFGTRVMYLVTKNTGRSDTTDGNTETVIDIDIRVAQRVGFDPASVAICAAGDDNMVFMHQPRGAPYLAEFSAYTTRLGLSAEPHLVTVPWDLDFCSSILVPTGDGWCLSPKPGRTLVKGWWRLRRQSELSDADWIVAVATSMHYNYSHVPVMRYWYPRHGVPNRHLLSQLRREDPSSPYQFNNDAVRTPSPAALSWFCARYRTSSDEVADLERSLLSLGGGPRFLNHPLIRRIVRRDLASKPGSQASFDTLFDNAENVPLNDSWLQPGPLILDPVGYQANVIENLLDLARVRKPLQCFKHAMSSNRGPNLTKREQQLVQIASNAAAKAAASASSNAQRPGQRGRAPASGAPRKPRQQPASAPPPRAGQQAPGARGANRGRGAARAPQSRSMSLLPEWRVLELKSRILLPDLGVNDPRYSCPRIGKGVTDTTAVANLPTGFKLPFDATNASGPVAADSLLPHQQFIAFNAACPEAELSTYLPANNLAAVDYYTLTNDVAGLYTADDECLDITGTLHQVADPAGGLFEVAFFDEEDPGGGNYAFIGIPDTQWWYIQVVSGGGNFTNAATYRMELEAWMGEKVTPITFTGAGTTTMSANVALVPDFYRFRTTPGTGTWSSVLLNNSLTVTIKCVATSNGTTAIKFGHVRMMQNYMLRASPSVTGAPLPEAMRNIGARATITQDGANLYKAGDVLGRRIPKGMLFHELVYPCNSSSVVQTNQDLMNTLIRSGQWARYNFARGISEASIPQTASDFEMRSVGQPGSAYRGTTAIFAPVSFQHLSGGNYMIVNTPTDSTTGPSSRTAFLSFATATEYTNKSASVQKAGPEYPPAIVDAALFELQATPVASGNSNHVVNALRSAYRASRPFLKAGAAIGGTAAMAAGTGLMAAPGAQGAAAALLGSGAAATALSQFM